MVKLVTLKELVTIGKEKNLQHVISTKVIESIVGDNAQHVKLTRVPLKYPCIICCSSEHHAPNYLKKTKVYNMFRTKPTISTIVMAKSSKPDNVPMNVVIAITTCNQVP